MKRLFERFIKRTFVEFGSGDKMHIGIATNFSENGLFIRSQHCFSVDTVLTIVLTYPGGKISTLKGVVKNMRKKTLLKYLNGMGIELLEKDPVYIDYVKTFVSSSASF
jgi:hypothetical protein